MRQKERQKYEEKTSRKKLLKEKWQKNTTKTWIKKDTNVTKEIKNEKMRLKGNEKKITMK